MRPQSRSFPIEGERKVSDVPPLFASASCSKSLSYIAGLAYVRAMHDILPESDCRGLNAAFIPAFSKVNDIPSLDSVKRVKLGAGA